MPDFGAINIARMSERHLVSTAVSTKMVSKNRTELDSHLTGPIQIRTGTAADREKLFAFWQQSLPGATRVIDLYRWRDLNPGASGGNNPYLAEQAGTIVGVINRVGLTVGCLGLRVAAGWQTDVVVSPAMRGIGIATQLMARVGSDNALVLGKGTTSAMHEAKRKFGFLDVPHQTSLVCPARMWFPEGPLTRRAKYAAAHVRSAWRRRPALPHGLCVEQVHEFNPEFDELAERVSGGQTLTPWKSSAYLNWRYFKCPGRSYRVLQAGSSAGLRGAVVVRGPEMGEKAAWIVDVIGDPGDTPAIDALVGAAREELSMRGAASIWAFATSRRIRARLRCAGFLNTKRSPRFSYFISGQLPFDPAAVEWNFLDGDGDCELYP